MSAAEVAELRAVFDRLTPIEESFDRYTTPETGGFLNKHVNNAFHLDPLFLRCTDLPDIIDLAEAVLGDDCHLIAMTAWLTGPGRPDQELHCDWLPVALPEDVLADPRVKMPVFITTAHLYLNDISEELGPTKIVPGSHKSGRRPDGETTWQGVGEQSIMCKGGRCGGISLRGVASRLGQHEQRDPLPAAGELRPAVDQPAVPPVPQRVPVRPGDPVKGDSAPIAADGGPCVEQLRLGYDGRTQAKNREETKVSSPLQGRKVRSWPRRL